MKRQAIPRSWKITFVVIRMDVLVQILTKIWNGLGSPRMNKSVCDVKVELARIRESLDHDDGPPD